MEMVLNRHLSKEEPLRGERRGGSPGLPPAPSRVSGGGTAPWVAFGQRQPRGTGPRRGCSPRRSPPGGGAAPAGAAVLNYSSEEALCLYCFHLLQKAQCLFSEQLSGHIGADKQCWSVFLRQPKFITRHLFIYFAGLWWWRVFFFE